MAQNETRLPAAVRWVGRGATFGALAVGLTTILGHVAGIDALTAPIAGRPRMSVMGAIAFTLAAIAILVDGPSMPRARRAARSALGVVVFVLGAAALADDTLDFWPSASVPSIPVAVGLILLGVAIGLLDRATRKGKRPAEALAALVGFIALLTLAGHTFDAPELYRLTPAHGTSLGGSVCMFLLAAATFCARPAEGLLALLASPTGGGMTARRLGLTAVVVIPGLGLVVAAAQQFFGFEERTSFSLVIAAATTLSLAVVAFTSADLDRSDRKLARASAAERELRTQIEAMSHASDAMSEAVARMEGTDVAPVLREIAEQARLVAGAEYAALGIASEHDPGSFAQLVTAGLADDVLQALGGLTPRATGVLGEVVLRNTSVRTRRVSEHVDSKGMPAMHPRISSFLGVPISFAGSQIGSLLLGNKRDGDEFTEGDQQMIEMLAARAGSALKAAQLHEVEARAREWLQTVINQMPEPMLVADADGRLLNWNRAAADARGHADALDAKGNPTGLDIRLPSGGPVPSEELPLAQALQRREAVTGVELLLKTHGGLSVPVVASAAPLRDLDGRIRGAVALFDNITALKQIERMREEWTAVIAHDLRQPLNGIVLHAQVLRRGLGAGASETQLESIDHIRVAGLRLNRMIEDLLDATRIEARRLKLERRAIALPKLVSQILKRMPVSGHAVRLDAQGELPDVDIDAVRVEQVISNLLSNAAKYGDAGTAIDISIQRDGAAVRVSVANSGSEVDVAELPRLFTRFYRTPSAETGPKPGLGLGLYIAKELIEAHGGRIWAESLERRTTFHFTLPLAVAAPGPSVVSARETGPRRMLSRQA